MCLGIPGKITDIYESNGIRMGKVDFSSVQREVCLEYVPDATIGDYVIVHVGFAISLLNQAEAEEALSLIREIANIEDELTS